MQEVEIKTKIYPRITLKISQMDLNGCIYVLSRAARTLWMITDSSCFIYD